MYVNSEYKEFAMNMRRTTLFLTEQQKTALEKLANKTGRKLSELMRQAIDEYLMRLEYPGQPPPSRAGWVKRLPDDELEHA